MESYGKKVQRFLHDIRIELKKVNWPTKREMLVFTSIVISAIIVVGIFFWFLDTGFTALLKLIIR
ncbi:MAG: preprotein translocase subunit SecE [Dethiobacter sp.]|jgi:preprotein translocase subunit SecE|nr:MAG: preprotein translocase subunit SecE [Dethiobacter sp.]